MNNKTKIIAEKGKQEFFIEREFDAPRELVFTAFNEPDLLIQWLAPNDFSTEIEKLDSKTHGSYRFIHKDCNGKGMTVGFNGVIHEVSAPERIIRTFEFEGLQERGHVSLEFLTLDVLPNDRTKLQIQSIFKSVADRDGMINSGMEGGMNEGFKKLDTLFEHYLKTQNKIRKQLKTNNMARVTTYLNFPGTTEEAFNSYKRIFGGDFGGKGIQRFGDLPPAEGQPEMSETDKKLIIHVELQILGGHILMATDAPESMGLTVTQGSNMHISLEPDSKKETKRLFDALSVNGNITMDLQDMPWGAYFGTCTDQYGINWMFNYIENLK